MAAAGCSLDEAFPDNTERAGKIAKREEKKKAMRCKGPALSFLKGGEKDPDRPAEPLPPPPEKMETNAKVNDPSEPITPYFGKGETDEGFANFSPSIDQNPGYKTMTLVSALRGFKSFTGLVTTVMWVPICVLCNYSTSSLSGQACFCGV